MKKLFVLIVCLLKFAIISLAQNVGIKTTSPQAALDVNGDIALRKATLTLPAGANNNVDISTNKFSVYDFAGSALTGGAQIYGFTGGTDGRIITVFNNSSTSAIQLVDETNPGSASSTAANRIVTGSGNSAIIYQNGSATLRYDGQKQRWTIINSNYTDGLSASSTGNGAWNASGANIYNSNSGNVGIGTSTPSKKFTVRATGIGITQEAVSGGPQVGFFTSASAAYVQTHTNHDLIFSTNNGNDDMILQTGTGNLGIGSNPTDFRVAISSNIVQGNTNTHLLSLKGQNPVLSFNDPNNNAIGYLKAWTYQPFAPYTNGLVIGAAPGYPIFFSTNFYGATMTIADNGNVGIGTTTPTYKLSVNGNIRSKEVVVETGWADYVFNNDYKLKPLAEVEKFIIQNHHLPNIPSAKEIEENGLKVGDTQKKMMEKIEELTLYVIELKKEIEKLKNK